MKNAPVLLNPGPVTLTEGVRQALQGPDQCPREPEFAELTQKILRGLESVYSTATADYRAVLLATSGTGAVEPRRGVRSPLPSASRSFAIPRLLK